MKLICRIDDNGIAWIGKYQQDEGWMQENCFVEPLTIVINNLGREDVTPENIWTAYWNYKGRTNGQRFSSQEIYEYYKNTLNLKRPI